MQTIAERLDVLPAVLAPLKEAARRYLKYPSVIGEDSVMNIGHRPWVAELNYMLKLYPGIKVDALNRYSRRFGIRVPEVYSQFLQAVNGGFFFGVSLCGIPHSMLGNPRLLDRSVLQCHDLATAASEWIGKYSVPAGFFHFGYRHLSFSANVGYFLDGEKRIVCVKGKRKIIGEWTSFVDFLQDELKASEILEDELHPAKWDG